MVVNPDIASKNASLMLRSDGDMMNGNIPKIENTTQTSAVRRNASRLAMLLCDGRMQKVINAPHIAVVAMDMMNARQSPSL